MTEFSMTINGSAVPTSETFGVVNPATGEIFAQAPQCSREQLDTAMESAYKAHLQWRVDEGARREVLHAAADALSAAVDELAPVLTAEQGKPLADAKAEITRASVWFNYFADLEFPPEVIQDNEKAFIEVVRRPLGVVAAITPWNFPVSLATWKIAPALLAGDTMVLKPSSFTPLATLKMGELLGRVLPPGVLNVVSGVSGLGQWMTSHPVPRKISLTGSTETGMQVAAAAAPDLKRLTLELGGNDPAIVLDDADPATIGEKLFWGAFTNNGQVCTAIKRVYVPERLYGDIVDALAEQARSVRVGNGMTEGIRLGPINNRPQFDRVSELVADAISGGASAVTGGKPIEGPGYFYEPTILANALDGTRIVDEEQFGPALPVVAYRSLDQAVERANASNFGLCGSVWGTDVERAWQVAARLECGTAWVNTHLAVQPNQPFGGWKWSGIGVENSRWGFYGFTELQTLHLAKS
jgi:acyl-CoA reductase-like NAD-dependent aldehyde dehydrogenase